MAASRYRAASTPVAVFELAGSKADSNSSKLFCADLPTNNNANGRMALRPGGFHEPAPSATHRKGICARVRARECAGTNARATRLIHNIDVKAKV